MADVKWIKIVTNIFDDEKIILIESMPDADSVIVIWFKLLCMAGKQNNSGVFMLNERIAYTDEMLATIFRRPLATVRLALKTFEQFGMIEIVDGAITIPNWDKHQTLDKIMQGKEATRKRVAAYRERQKQLAAGGNDDVTACNALRNADVTPTDKDKEGDKEKEEDKRDIKPSKQKYGEFANVLLTEDELQKLKSEYSDYKAYIERLSAYIAQTGKRYKSHYATILNWIRRDEADGKRKPNAEKSTFGNVGKFL